MLYNALSIIKFSVHNHLFTTIDKAIENIEKCLVKSCVIVVVSSLLSSFIDQLKAQLQLYPKALTLSAPKLSYWVGNFTLINSLILN